MPLRPGPAPALEAAIAVRDVMVMMATAAYPSCEHALQDIVLRPEEQHQSIGSIIYVSRGQVHLHSR